MDIMLGDLQAFWLLNGAVSLLLYPVFMDMIDKNWIEKPNYNEVVEKTKSKALLYINGNYCCLYLGGKYGYMLDVVDNLLHLNTYNLMYGDRIIGAINKKINTTGKIHLGEFTSGRIKTCHLYQVEDYPNYFLLKDGKTGGDLSIDERPFLTVNEV